MLLVDFMDGLLKILDSTPHYKYLMDSQTVPLEDYLEVRPENRKKVEGVSREARDLLITYDYPGNVRELENIIERAVVISRSPVLSREDLPFPEVPCEAESDHEPQEGSLRDALETLERQMVRDALEKAGFNQSQAAKLLGLNERMLRYKLKKYGLK